MFYWTHTKPDMLRSLSLLAVLTLFSLLFTGCSTVAPAVSGLPMDEIAKYSPAPEVVSPFDAIEGAKKYVSAHPGSDYSIGSGNSMAPLYRDHSVIVTERKELGSLHVGQTVVFMGSQGVPVAHTLIARSGSGWVTMGLGNAEPDQGVLTDAAYMGVVVRAYQATGSPILAYAKTAPRGSMVASNP